MAPFVPALNANTTADTLFPTGATFGVTGTAGEGVIGPVIAGVEQLLPSPNIGVATTETIGSTDGTATGSFTYTHDFGSVPAAPGRQITGVTWTAGSTTLTAAAGSFNAATDVNPSNPVFVAGPTGTINPQSTITAVSADGSTATISIPTLAAGSAAAIGLGQTLQFADPTLNTGTVFTTNGANGGKANIGVTGVSSITLHAAIDIPFGPNPGVGTTNCLETGWDAAGNPGPPQTGETVPALPAPPNNVTNLLVAASGGFITQPGTTQAITPPAAASVNLVDPAPVTTDTSATINRNTSNTTTVTLPATDTDATPVASCAAGAPSDPRLTVSISNSPTACVATLTDTGGASTGATVTFPFSATDTAGNTGNTSTATVTITPIPHVAISTTSLPDVVVNTPYNQTLQATGGTPPYTWSISSGSLPPGLTLSPSTGVISGTPTMEGTFNFTAMVTDSDTPAETATQPLSIMVTPAPVPDGALQTIVNGGVSSTKTSKAFVGKVTNTGTGAGTFHDSDVTWTVTVNGTAVGTVTGTGASTTLGTGVSKRFKYTWSYPAGAVHTGDTVVFTGTLNTAGDPTPGDNTSSVTKTAK